MTGALDEVSRVIGKQEATLAGLKHSFDRHCNDDDRRHKENIETMRGIRDEIAGLRQVIEPLVQSVAVMRPIVDGYQVTRTKLAAWASIGFGIIVIVGWIVEAGIKWAVGALLRHFN